MSPCVTPDPGWRARRDLLPALALVYVFVANVDSVVGRVDLVPLPLERTGHALGLSQGWSMYVPPHSGRARLTVSLTLAEAALWSCVESLPAFVLDRPSRIHAFPGVLPMLGLAAELGLAVPATLVTNDHLMAGTPVTNRRYMKAYVYWPLAIQPAAKDALLKRVYGIETRQA